MKEDVQPKKRSEKIIISISGETSEWLELYCKTDGILRKDFVSLPLDYFEHTGFDLLSQGDTKGASLYLDKAGETPEKTLLQGIMQMLNGNYTEAENLLRKAEEAGLPQASENLKILHEIY